MGWRARGLVRGVGNGGQSKAGHSRFWAPCSKECVRCEVGQGRESHLPSSLLFSALPTRSPSHLGGSLAQGSRPSPTPVDFRGQPPAFS